MTDKQLKFGSHLDYFPVSLHSFNGRQMAAVRAVQGDCQWPLKSGGKSHRSHHCDRGPNLYLDQPVTKGQSMPGNSQQWADVTKASYLIWANGRCFVGWGSPPHAWLATVNWWFMQAAGPCASPIRPAACIVPVYCIHMSETVTFTAI